LDRNPALLYKILVVGVIVIFIGIGIQPAFAFTPNISNNNCELCPKIDSEQNSGNARKTICDILGILLLRLIIKDVLLANFIDDIEDTNPFLCLISTTFVSIVFIRLLFIAFIGIKLFSCDDYWVNPGLQSYTL